MQVQLALLVISKFFTAYLHHVCKACYQGNTKKSVFYHYYQQRILCDNPLYWLKKRMFSLFAQCFVWAGHICSAGSPASESHSKTKCLAVLFCIFLTKMWYSCNGGNTFMFGVCEEKTNCLKRVFHFLCETQLQQNFWIHTPENEVPDFA